MGRVNEVLQSRLIGAIFNEPIWACLILLAFAFGWMVARWRADRKRADSDLESRNALNLLQDVSHRTGNISREITEYRELLADLAQRVDGPNGSDSATDLLSQFMNLNRHLQQRLVDSERTLQEQSEQLHVYISEARVDSHSGLHNRRSFDEEMERHVAYWRRKRHPFSLVMIDIDHFKSINDRYGHQAGDAVIQSIAASLRQTLRTSDFVARYGGEEFAAVLRGSDLEMGIRAAERCCEAIRDCGTMYHGQRLHVTASCGVATIQEEEDAKRLIERADQALYRAKESGRNTVVVHDGADFQPLHPADDLCSADVGSGGIPTAALFSSRRETANQC